MRSSDLSSLDKEIKDLKECNGELDEQLRKIENQIAHVNEEAGTVLWVFLAELSNIIRNLRMKQLQNRKDEVYQRSAELEEARKSMSEEKKGLVDSILQQYKVGKQLDTDSLKTLGFTKETVDSVMDFAKALESGAQGGTFSVFDLLEKTIAQVKMDDVVEDQVVDKVGDKLSEKEKDVKRQNQREAQSSKNRQRVR